MKKSQQTNLAAILCALISILILYQCAPLLQSATAETECGCQECPCQECPEVVPLSGAELYKALSEALQNEDVKTLKDAFKERDYTPDVSDATAYKGADGFTVVIPFKGDCLYSAIYYLHAEDFKGAAAATVYELGDEWVMDTYEITDEGELKITEIRGHSCSTGCIYDCLLFFGISPIGAVACVAACLSCMGGLLPACMVCGFCSGFILGCIDVCCGY